MKRESISKAFSGVGMLCGYASMFLAAAGQNNIAAGLIIAMVINVLAGFALSDYFLDSFK